MLRRGQWSRSGFCDGKEVANDQRRSTTGQHIMLRESGCYSHVPGISFDSERKTASYFWVLGVRIRILQGTARKDGFLSVVESYCTKLLPV